VEFVEFKDSLGMEVTVEAKGEMKWKEQENKKHNNCESLDERDWEEAGFTDLLIRETNNEGAGSVNPKWDENGNEAAVHENQEQTPVLEARYFQSYSLLSSLFTASSVKTSHDFIKLQGYFIPTA